MDWDDSSGQKRGKMVRPYRKLNMYEPSVFRICIQGELNESWSEYFCAQSVSVELDQAGNSVTSMVSEPIDQAALLGILNQLNTLGIPLISVSCATRD
jgi:hypothetical protein